MGSALHVQVNSMRYPGSRDTLDLIGNLAFDVAPNEVISFLGRSGAGKTTMLRMIAGLERRFVGTVIFAGKPVERPTRAIQMVFQDFRLLPWKTVEANVAFAARNGADPTAPERVRRWIHQVGLDHRRNAWPKTLSGGEVGRAAFARAFVDQPQLLLLDEPFRGLDLATRIELQDALLEALQVQRTSVILISHSVEDAVFLSDRVHVLASRPMHIARTIEVPLDRPRCRSDPRVGELIGDLTDYMAHGEPVSGEGGRP